MLRANYRYFAYVSCTPGVDLDSPQRFQTKQQLLHRLQEGISFGDGVEYTPAEYLDMASKRALEWKTVHYPEHELVLQDSASNEQLQRKLTEDKEMSAPGTPSLLTVPSADNSSFTVENLERDYWDIVEKSKEVIVEYGNDVDSQEFGSGFPLSERGRAINGTKNPEKMSQPEPRFGEPDYYKETWWNLNNIPCAPESVLRHVRVGITGIST